VRERVDRSAISVEVGGVEVLNHVPLEDAQPDLFITDGGSQPQEFGDDWGPVEMMVGPPRAIQLPEQSFGNEAWSSVDSGQLQCFGEVGRASGRDLGLRVVDDLFLGRPIERECSADQRARPVGARLSSGQRRLPVSDELGISRGKCLDDLPGQAIDRHRVGSRVMEGAAEWLEHCIPDVVCTEDLPVLLAAEVDFLAGRLEPWLNQSRHIDAPTSARSLAFSSRAVEAAEVLASIDVDALDANGIATVACAASRSGGPSVFRLLEQLATLSADFLGDEVPAGPRAMFVGMLLAAQGNLVNAATELRAAVDFGDTRAPLWGAVARL
jgi:hypothetical protein